MKEDSFTFLRGLGYVGSLAQMKAAYGRDTTRLDPDGGYDPIRGPFGWVCHKGPRNKSGVYSTLDEAESRGKGTVAYFPSGDPYEIGDTLSLAGYSCQIWGSGAAMLNASTPAGTVFRASSQVGPVLNFKDWSAPLEFSGKVRHGGFAVQGSNSADPTKANSGILIDFLQSTTFSDITIQRTGGPGLKLTSDVPGRGCYLNDFERIIIRAPIGAYTNNVPYFHAIQANGNRFRSFGLISRQVTQDTGVSGASVIESTSTWHSHDNLFEAWWLENLHVPTDGTLFSNAANQNVYRDIQFFDIKRETGATNTTHYRFLPTGTVGQDLGANLLQGLIPGNNNGAASVPQYGVDLQQSGNVIEGMKGYKGENVLIGAGVGRTYVDLKGAQSGATDIGWINNSGTTTNHLIDHAAQVEVRPSGWAVS